MQALDSCVRLNYKLLCIELGVLCQFVLVGVISITNDEDIVYVTGVVQYLFGLYEGSDVGMF